MYLPEDQPGGFIQYEAFGTDGYDPLAKAYNAAREPALASTWLTIRKRFPVVSRKPVARPDELAVRTIDRELLKPNLDAEIT